MSRQCTKEINHFRRCRNQSYKTYLNNKTENWIHYKQSRNICNSAERKAKRNFLISGLKKPSATLWKHLKTSCGSSKLRSTAFPWRQTLRNWQKLRLMRSITIL